MFILSIDVGIRNLSYTIIEINNGIQELSIKDWNNLNLLEDFNNLRYMNTIYTKMKLPTLQKFTEHHKLQVTGKFRKNYIETIASFMKIKKIRNTKYSPSLNELCTKLIESLDSITNWMYTNNINLDHIIIENQPNVNFQMRNIQIMIFTYFMMKKSSNTNIECISPSLKSKFCDNYLKNDSKRDTYSDRKNTSVKLIKDLIGDDIENFQCWKGKKDDLADVVCQALGFYYKITN